LQEARGRGERPGEGGASASSLRLETGNGPGSGHGCRPLAAGGFGTSSGESFRPARPRPLPRPRPRLRPRVASEASSVHRRSPVHSYDVALSDRFKCICGQTGLGMAAQRKVAAGPDETDHDRSGVIRRHSPLVLIRGIRCVCPRRADDIRSHTSLANLST
jgi:hypothetical protein